MELTDGERLVLAILSEPLDRKAIGGGITPISPQRVAAIWSGVNRPADAEAELHPERLG